MNIEQVLTTKVKEAVKDLYGVALPSVEFQPTRKDFEGDITVVIFPMLRFVKGNPEKIGATIGDYLIKEVAKVADFNVIKGFLNITISNSYYLEAFARISSNDHYGIRKEKEEGAVMVEYSSPNTNKPLHLWLKYSKLPERKCIKHRSSMTGEFIFVKVCWPGNYMVVAKHRRLQVLKGISSLVIIMWLLIKRIKMK